MSARQTDQPSLAYFFARLRPNPLAAPVIRIRFTVSPCISLLSLLVAIDGRLNFLQIIAEESVNLPVMNVKGFVRLFGYLKRTSTGSSGWP
jgi:hypothetical protein